MIWKKEDNCYHCACFKIFTFLSYHLIFKLFSENEKSSFFGKSPRCSLRSADLHLRCLKWNPTLTKCYRRECFRWWQAWCLRWRLNNECIIVFNVLFSNESQFNLNLLHLVDCAKLRGGKERYWTTAVC
jgi:hypothetical protein